MGQEDYEAWRARREEKKRKAREARAKMREYWKPEARRVHKELIDMIKDGTAGVNQATIARVTGMAQSSISNFMNRRTKSLRFSTFVAVAGACGYKVVLEPIDPDQDFLYKKRRVKLPPREKDLKKAGNSS